MTLGDSEDSEDSYLIVFGGYENTRSWIEKNGERLVTAATEDILSGSEYR